MAYDLTSTESRGLKSGHLGDVGSFLGLLKIVFVEFTYWVEIGFDDLKRFVLSFLVSA